MPLPASERRRTEEKAAWDSASRREKCEEGGKVWDKPITQPSKFLRRVEDLAVKGNR